MTSGIFAICNIPATDLSPEAFAKGEDGRPSSCDNEKGPSTTTVTPDPLLARERGSLLHNLQYLSKHIRLKHARHDGVAHKV